MDTTSVTIPTEGQPSIVPLPPMYLACMACGQQVNPPYQTADVEHFYAYADSPRGRVVSPGPQHDAALTRCPECLLIRQRAQELLEEHPRVGAQIGGRSVALHRVESALSGLDALGASSRVTLHTDKALRLLIEHLTPIGATVWWSQRFTPVLAKGASDQTCASSRWAHLTGEQRTALHQSFGEMLQARVEQPRPYSPPADADLRGCLLCGIGAVEALPSRSDSVWTAESVGPGTLGGRPGTERIDGYTCPSCARAVEDAGSIGVTAMERSLIRHLGILQRSMSAPELVGLKGWATLPDSKPNASPWAHIPNLDQLGTDLQ